MFENLTRSKWVNDKYQKFYDNKGYLPHYFDVYNELEIIDIAPNIDSKFKRRHGLWNIVDNRGVQSMTTFNLTYSSYVNKKYKEFYEKRGYIPQIFNPYNCSEIRDICPSLTTACNSITSSSSVLIIEEVES